MCLNAEPWHVIDKSLYGLPGIAFGRALTAYLAAAITRPVRVDEPHVVIGWLQSASGRRSLVGSAIVNVGYVLRSPGSAWGLIMRPIH